jgi:Acyl-CoA reductase (LuxC)
MAGLAAAEQSRHKAVPSDELSRAVVLAPSGQDLHAMRERMPIAPFSPAAIAFVERLSKGILTGGSFRAFPEMIAFAHWMRRARIRELQASFQSKKGAAAWQGRGVVFHIAPSNVDTIFLYSFLLSLLMGNSNIVRLSTKRTPQVMAVIALIDNLLSEPGQAEIRSRLALVSYEHDDQISAALSMICDLRVVWGGDQTVAAIRRLPLPPNARDLCFPDKWSISVFDAEAFLSHGETDSIVRSYVNDTYWFGQMACSSPRLMIWRGKPATCDAASERFWPLVESAAAALDTGIAPIDMVNKYVAESQVAIGHAVQIRKGSSNLLNVVRFTDLDDLPLEEHCGAGLFYEATIGDLESLRCLIGRKLQTVVSFGVPNADWQKLLQGGALRGIDRIVPVGEALAFATTWDGYDLMREFCREISLGI